MIAMVAGKTLNVTQLLMGGMPTEVSPVFMTFSARTGANQTQDFIDSKMDKRRKAGSLRDALLGWLLTLNLSGLTGAGLQVCAAGAVFWQLGKSLTIPCCSGFVVHRS